MKNNSDRLLLIFIIVILVLGVFLFIMGKKGESKCVISEEGLEVYREEFLISCNGVNTLSDIINSQSHIINLFDVNDSYPSPDEPFPIFDCNKLLEEIDRQATQE